MSKKNDQWQNWVTAKIEKQGRFKVSERMVAIVQFIISSQEDESLVGLGEQPDNKIDVLVNMVVAVGDLILINAGDLEKACQQLSIILLKCDGQDSPPDFVQDGENTEGATAELAEMIENLMEDLGCG
jgi:hypothetical protein